MLLVLLLLLVLLCEDARAVDEVGEHGARRSRRSIVAAGIVAAVAAAAARLLAAAAASRHYCWLLHRRPPCRDLEVAFHAPRGAVRIRKRGKEKKAEGAPPLFLPNASAKEFSSNSEKWLDERVRFSPYFFPFSFSKNRSVSVCLLLVRVPLLLHSLQAPEQRDTFPLLAGRETH